MKNLKRVISIVLVAATIFAMLAVNSVAVGGGNGGGNASIMNNNTFSTTTLFAIDTNGAAELYVRYTGYSGVTTGAQIDIVIKKNLFLFVWTTVVEESYEVEGYRYSNIFEYDLSPYTPGTYKCNVTYTVSGSGGDDDVIPYEGTASF